MSMTVFDAAEYLPSPDAQKAFLEAALETNDTDFIAHALGVIARARGMAEIAAATGIPRQSLYRSLSKGGNPTLRTVTKVMDALDLRLAVTGGNA